jgi:hypothetical protein
MQFVSNLRVDPHPSPPPPHAPTQAHSCRKYPGTRISGTPQCKSTATGTNLWIVPLCMKFSSRVLREVDFNCRTASPAHSCSGSEALTAYRPLGQFNFESFHFVYLCDANFISRIRPFPRNARGGSSDRKSGIAPHWRTTSAQTHTQNTHTHTHTEILLVPLRHRIYS